MEKNGQQNGMKTNNLHFDLGMVNMPLLNAHGPGRACLSAGCKIPKLPSQQ